jgi:HEPN domain-containing protein
MKNETRRWLRFARTNLGAARCVLESGYLNPCLQEAQQAVKKALKAVLVEHGVAIKKTHSAFLLRENVLNLGMCVPLDDADCAFLDSIYLPSKYPLGSVLPDGDPDEEQCRQCLAIAEKTLTAIGRMLGENGEDDDSPIQS